MSQPARFFVPLVLTLLGPGCASRPAPLVSPPPTSAPAPAAALPPFAAAGSGGVVATVQTLATEAGADALRRGGNAIDAAVAAALTLGVVDGHNSGIGGGCFLLIRKPDGDFLAIDGRETAPAGASRDMFLKDGKAVPGASTTGPLAVGVPGSLAAYDYALTHGGKLKLADLLRRAADLAERGFPIDAVYARRLAATAADLARFPESAGIFLDSAGRHWPRGHVLRQPDLARSYRAIADHGAGWFYGGPFATNVEEWMKAHGGVVSAKDFADYRVRLRDPLVSTYRGYTLVGFPPPSSGGLHVAQILNILENFDLKELERQGAALRLHVTAEAMKLAFADRAFWLGDPDFAKVPRGLLSKEYARSLASRIDLHRAIDVPDHGHPPEADTDVFGSPGSPLLPGSPAAPLSPPSSAPEPPERHTTHIAAADAEGNWVALTTTLNTSFGSKVVAPGTGILLNDQMDDFSVQPGAPNAFGLVGAEANAVAPGKRPLSSMSPTVVLKGGRNGQPVLTLGSAGGPMIINDVVQVIVNHIDLDMPLPDAVFAPRIHHQWRPDVLYAEPGVPAAAVRQLEALGHKVERRDPIATGQAVGRAEGGSLIGVHDPRVPGEAIGVDR